MEPSTREQSLARARMALSHLRRANDLLAKAHRSAAIDAGENLIRYEHERRNDSYLPDLLATWDSAALEFRRASELVAPTIDFSLRLADIESLGASIKSGAINPEADDAGLVSQVSGFDLQVHELFMEIQRAWPELASEAPLAEHQADYEALRAPWRLALGRRPVLVLSSLALLIYVIGSILWMTISRM